MGVFSDIMSNYTFLGPGMQPAYSPNPTEADRQKYNKVQRRRAYFDGLSGLQGGARADWEKRYLKQITGKNPYQQDQFFKNTVFKELFKNSTDPEKQKIWNNRHDLTPDQRDVYVARDIVEDYDRKGGPKGILTEVAHNRQAMNVLDYASDKQANKYKEYLYSLNGGDRKKILDELDTISNATSSLYKKYAGTDKLNLSEEDKIDLLSKFQAWNEVGGSTFAQKALGEHYQNIVANNQSLWEKAINSGAQFIDSAVGMLIRAAGMIGAATTLGKKEGEGYWEHIIDNEVTRYGDRVATTNTYDPEEQEKLEKLGLSDNPIIGTLEQQESMLSANTPFELFGQYGFTTASTILSFGSSALVNATAKGAAWAAKAATASKGLNTTAKGVKFLRGVIRAKDIGNIAVVGGIGAVEGGMNAAQTKNEVLNGLNADIDDKYRQKAQEDIANQVRKDPQGAARLLRARGYDIPERIPITKEGKTVSPYNEKEVNQMIGLLQGDESIMSAALGRYSKSITDDRIAAEKSAKTSMYIDFVGNSIINGFIHSTLQASLNAPSVQNTLRKFGLAKSPLERRGVEVVREQGKWLAKAKKYTKLNAFGNRLKESLGEGLEEYNQNLSSGFAQGYGEDKYRQYLNNKYAGSSVEDALDNDIASSFMAGLRSFGEAAISKQAIKEGLYGGLSTIMGGFNVNSHILNGTRKGERKEGESYLNYISRKSPIGWRSAFGPLISNSEVDAVNARREEITKNINDFFSKPEVQESFFNVNSTSEWMRQLETAAENKDQLEVRNAKLGVLFSNIATLNSLSGSGYYDAVIASLQARANLNEENLQDEDSEESKLVAMYKQDALNRGQSVTDEEALHSIKSSASKMLETIDKVDKETEEVEKLYGEDLDKDVKAGLVFQRIAIEDSKNRKNQLDNELNSVTSKLAEEPSDVEASSRALNKSAKTLMARFGSLTTATTRLEELEKDRQDLKESLKSIKSDQKSATTDEEKTNLAQVRVMSERALKNTEKEYKELKSLISNYQSTAFTESNDRGEAVATDNQPISALDIMNLDAQDRAFMLDPSHRENYSQEQQAEIDKVNRIGVQTYQDFASKIQDSSRLAFSYEASMQRQLEMMADPKSFMKVANSLKYEAQKRFLEKKYNYLLDLEEQGDYNSFARELDKIRVGNSVVDADAAFDLLKRSDSEFLKRYYSENQSLSNLFAELSKGQNEAYNNLDANQKGVFYDTLKYLNNKGIDINDTNSVINALSEQDEQGNSLFEQYVKNVNENAREEAKSEFTSVGEAIQAYKDVMGEYNTSEQEKANNAKETPVAPTTSGQSAPPKAPSAKGPSLTEMGTAEESARRSQEADKEGVVEDPVTEAYKENSGQEIADLSKLASNSISNASSTTSNQESKNLALDEVRRLSDVKFDNVDDYADALLQSANKLDSQSEEDGDNEGRAADLLRAAATRVRARVDESKRKSEEEKAKNNTPQDRKTNLAERKLTSPIRSAVNVNAALMDTIPIAWIRQNYPNSPLVKYYDNHRIEEFLETDFMSSKPAVMFISDPQLAEAVKADIESRNLEYTEDSIPLIAVVEVPTGGITIKVNGEDKHFQPIGIMPRTGNANSNGSNRLGAIRNLIDRQDSGQLVRDSDGNIVTTTIGGNVIAEAPKQLPATEPNRSAISLQINDLNEKEKKELQNLSKPDRRKNPIYWRIKQEFLKKLAIATPEGKGKYLYYALPNLKGQVIDVRVFTTPVNLTRDRNSNRLISELFNSNEVSAALNSNSRISRAAKELRKFFEKSFDTSEMYFEADDAGNIVPTESTAKKLSALSEQLTKSIGNFLSLPTRDGWKYVISPTSEVIGDGRRMFTLSLTNNEGSQIELGKVTNGQMQENTQFNILKNLIMDGSSVRMVSNRESFVKWNVPYSDVQNMNSNKAAKDNISDIYDDGILEFSKDSLRYHVKGLSINSPFTMQGEANYTKQDEVSSPTNAQPTTPLNQPVVAANDQVTTPKGTIVDSESGAVLEEESTSSTQPSTDVKPIVDSIVANSKIIQLSKDKKYYINTRTGKKYARVTSIIQADEHSDGRFDPNSPWITPSTNIGTGMDEFVRDFFAGKLNKYIQSFIPFQLWKHMQNMGLSVSGSKGMQEFLKTHNLQSVQQAIESPEVQKEMDEIKQKAIADGTFMKAPNGNPTNLTERQWVQVRTKAFKDWFGDWQNDPKNASKVVDENGEPLVVYHGSNEYGFKVFDPSKSDDKISLFASSSKWIASTYTSFKPLENTLVRKALLKGNAIDLIKNEDWKSLEKLINSVIDINLPRPEEFGYPMSYDGNEKVLDEVLAIQKELDNPNLTEEEQSSLLADLTKAEDKYYYSGNYTFRVKQRIIRGKNNIEISIDDSYDKEFNSSYYNEGGVIFRGSPEELIDALTFDTKVYDLFLNIKNPLTLDNQVNEYGHANNWNNLDFAPAAKEVQNRTLWGEATIGTHKETKTRDVAAYAKEHGYDGVIFKQIADKGGYPGYQSLNPMTDADLLYADTHIGEDSYDATYRLKSDIFISFNSNQIKSATDNVGTFSRTNNDVTAYATPQGEVYGFVDKEGNVYLDETKISPEHPIHEYTHLWDRVVQQKNPKLWNRGIELMKQTTLWNEILNSKHYGKAWQQLGINGERLNNLIASEVHARLTGTEGEALLKELANKKGQSNIISKLKDWLLDIWKTLGETFGTWNKEALDNLTLEDFNHLTIRDFARGYNPVNNTFKTKQSKDDLIHITNTFQGLSHLGNLQEWSKKASDIRNKPDGFGTENGLFYYKKSQEGRGGDNVTIWFKNEPSQSIKEKIPKLLDESKNLNEFGDKVTKLINDSTNTSNISDTLESKYPNATRESLEKFAQQLLGLKNSLDAQGLTVVPRDIVATGSIEVTDSEGKKHTIDVAGTLDLLAYDGKGNFYIFDMKTHHSANVGGKIDKWRRQLTLYKTFLESQYGINVKSLNIIPIKVEYPTPKGVGNSTNEFTVKEGNQLLLNGKEFTGANPNLGMTIALNPIELNVLFDNLTEEEKSQIRESEASQSEVGTVERVDAKEEGDGSFIEPMTGLRKAKSKDLRRKKKGKGGAVKKPVERLTPVPAKYQWGKFEGATTSDGDIIDAKLATSNLEKAGYTEESWNQLSDEEMQHELDCKGV